MPIIENSVPSSYPLRNKNVQPKQKAHALTTPINPSNIIASYPLNGDAKDTSGHNRNCVAWGQVSSTEDQFGHSNSAVRFGSGGHFTCERITYPPAKDIQTIAVWAKFDGADGDLLSKSYYHRDGLILTVSNQELTFSVPERGYGTYIKCLLSTFDLTKWHFIVATHEGEGQKPMKLYIDGEKVAEGQTPSVINDSVGLIIGNWFGGGRPFKGALDNVTLYNQTLSAPEIWQLYTEPFISPHPSRFPTQTPSISPSSSPSLFPSLYPSPNPTLTPSVSPSWSPTRRPSLFPSLHPSPNPTLTPSFSPTWSPTRSPSSFPSFNPTLNPSFFPSWSPTRRPSSFPSFNPTLNPSVFPSLSPSFRPSVEPTKFPTRFPSYMPTLSPSTRDDTLILNPDWIIARYPFNGDAKDTSKYHNDCTPYGNVQLTQDRKGRQAQAYRFAGGYLDCGSGIGHAQNIKSITLWAQFYGTNSGELVSKSNNHIGIEINLFNNQLVFYVMGAGDYGIGYPISHLNLYQWYFIVATQDADRSDPMKLYINGQQVAESPLPSRINDAPKLMIGNWNRLDRPFYGGIDDVTLYNRALNKSQICQLYESDFISPFPSLMPTLNPSFSAPTSHPSQYPSPHSESVDASIMKYIIIGCILGTCLIGGLSWLFFQFINPKSERSVYPDSPVTDDQLMAPHHKFELSTDTRRTPPTTGLALGSQLWTLQTFSSNGASHLPTQLRETVLEALDYLVEDSQSFTTVWLNQLLVVYVLDSHNLSNSIADFNGWLSGEFSFLYQGSIKNIKILDFNIMPRPDSIQPPYIKVEGTELSPTHYLLPNLPHYFQNAVGINWNQYKHGTLLQFIVDDLISPIRQLANQSPDSPEIRESANNLVAIILGHIQNQAEEIQFGSSVQSVQVKDKINQTMCQIGLPAFQTIFDKKWKSLSLIDQQRLVYCLGRLAKAGVLGYHQDNNNQANTILYLLCKHGINRLRTENTNLPITTQFLNRFEQGQCIAILSQSFGDLFPVIKDVFKKQNEG